MRKPNSLDNLLRETGNVETLEEAFGAVPPLSKPEDFKKLRDAAIGELVSANRK